MNQLAIDFSPRKHARSTDPATSHAAAAEAEKFASSQAGKVWAALKSIGAAGKTRIAKHTGLTGVQVDRRLPDLYAKGKAAPLEQTELSDAGRSERLWVAL